MRRKGAAVLAALTVALVAAVGIWLARSAQRPDPQAAAPGGQTQGEPDPVADLGSASVPGPPAAAAPGPAAAAAPPGGDYRGWAVRTEEALTAMAERLGPEARLDAVVCGAGSCRLELSHQPTPAGGQRVQELLVSALELLPDSVTQPDVAPGKTVITLSLAPETTPRRPRRDDDTDSHVAHLRIR